MPEQGKLKFKRSFSTAGVHPYEEVAWEKRDIVMTNWRDGKVNFEQKNVEFPDFWSMNATQIVTSKYFRGKLGTKEREKSLKQLIDRVVKKYVDCGIESEYFASKKDAEIFSDELTWMLLHQYFSFNSPVWFNVGTDTSQQVSACFILSVGDSMEDILNWYTEEGRIFKRGSGAGVNLSRIRSRREGLSTGGIASGPVSFMRGADASAGTIASGGATRRAAKMVVLDVDHPDILDFINTKVHEEDKIRALQAAGFDMGVDGKDTYSVQYQNANNSVRVSNKFMKAVEADGDFDLIARTNGKPVETLKAREVWDKLCEAAWACADPGIQYDDTINNWHTIPKEGKITASNPCSEFMSIDNSSCNLASVNLLKFLKDDGKFDVKKFVVATEVIFTAMDISVTFGEFPTEKITENTKDFRALGLGYANLGALLMTIGVPYDSDEGRAIAAGITSLMTAAAYRRSAELAAAVGPYKNYERNAKDQLKIIKKHSGASEAASINSDGMEVHVNLEDIFEAAGEQWQETLEIGQKDGFRNCQASLLAPTGTIGFMMDCDTTGIEPDFSLVKYKKLVGGGSMQIVNQSIPRALETLGYDKEQIEAIINHITESGAVVDAPHLKKEHYAIFDCAVGERAIKPMGHIEMMAAVQPFLSGAISKTVNMPESATVDEIKEAYMQGWKLGLKAVAIYRDNCKASQPLSDKKDKEEDESTAGPAQIQNFQRRRLPRRRNSNTYSFSVAGAEGYVTTGMYENGDLGEIFVKLSKQGSTLSGIMDTLSICVSLGLQYGVPLETYVKKFSNMQFEPAGMTNDPDIPFAKSLVDYIFRRLALDHLPFDVRSGYGIYSTAERLQAVDTGVYEPLPETMTASSSSEENEIAADRQTKLELKVEAGQANAKAHSTVDLMSKDSDAPLCLNCGVKMRPAGSCHICELCGSTSGCS
ncbi:MAG: vitamin B12-dependent ribonucleotide reductase [Candidatus Nomurabacteria bacterium]|jgi:ribonucleoside-diphosphate reductase alpha chain|nr:vitamin B12-dependent ribonucleotide reductase [Candidatus Nomurabacteria bacterium]